MQLPNIIDKRKLAGITNFTEHTFTKKNIPHTDAIQATYQFSILPGFGTMCMAKCVQSCIGIDDIIVDPGSVVLLRIYLFTIFYNSSKSTVAGLSQWYFSLVQPEGAHSMVES